MRELRQNKILLWSEYVTTKEVPSGKGPLLRTTSAAIRFCCHDCELYPHHVAAHRYCERGLCFTKEIHRGESWLQEEYVDGKTCCDASLL